MVACLEFVILLVYLLSENERLYRKILMFLDDLPFDLENASDEIDDFVCKTFVRNRESR